MPDMLQQASEWLEDQRVKHVTRSVTYQRSAELVEVSATIGRTVFEQADEYGAIVRHEARDFLILADDLVLGGQTALPDRGDRIREPQGEKVFVYEVMAPGKEPAWRYSDPYRKTLRIHTKQVDTEDG